MLRWLRGLFHPSPGRPLAFCMPEVDWLSAWICLLTGVGATCSAPSARRRWYVESLLTNILDFSDGDSVARLWFHSMALFAAFLPKVLDDGFA